MSRYFDCNERLAWNATIENQLKYNFRCMLCHNTVGTPRITLQKTDTNYYRCNHCCHHHRHRHHYHHNHYGWLGNVSLWLCTYLTKYSIEEEKNVYIMNIHELFKQSHWTPANRQCNTQKKTLLWSICNNIKI